MIKLENVSKFYNSKGQIISALHKINLELGRNEFVAITGESGSGKTTLLNVLSGNDTYEEGTMYVDEINTSGYTTGEWEEYRQNYVGFVFQNYNIIESFTVLDNVMLALMLMNYDESRRKQRAIDIIKRVGLGSHLKHRASKLSGGQKQRLVIARALAKDTPIIACDEPTGNLDKDSGAKIMELLAEISKDKLVIVVTHNYPEVQPYATRKLRMFDGELVEDEQLKKSSPCDITNGEMPSIRISFKDKLRFAFKNLFATPKKNIFAFIIFLLSSLILGSSYGSYLKGFDSDDIFKSSSFYSSIPETRVVVTKKDNAEFSNQEIEDLKAMRHVKTLTTYDFALDQMISGEGEHDNVYYSISGYCLPLTLVKNTDLLEGRMPANDNEFLLIKADNESIDSYEEQLGISYSTSDSSFSTMTPVGIVNSSSLPLDSSYSTYYLVTDNYLKVRSQKAYFEKYCKMSLYDGSQLIASVDGTIGIVTSGTRTITFYGDSGTSQLNLSLKVTDPYSEKTFTSVNTSYVTSGTKPNYSVGISADLYNEISVISTRQISIFTSDKSQTSSVVSALKDLDYKAYVVADFEPDLISNILNIVVIIVGAIGLVINVVIIYFVSYLILRLIAQSKAKEYLIIRSIGASKSFISQDMLIENIVLCFLGTICSMAFMIIRGLCVPTSNYNSYGIIEYVILLGVLLLLAVFLSFRVRKHLFSHSLASALKEE